MKTTHIDVTLDFTNLGSTTAIDLRIPTQQPVGELIVNLCQTLKVENLLKDKSTYSLRIINKNKIVSGNTILADTNASNGDLLEIVV
ncbi:MAG: EsaB/YukD family protein [Culicoidibacterales bacterium]